MLGTRVEENDCLKQKLEESCLGSITMTQIFNSKEKENYEGSQKLKDRYREAKNAIEDEAARRRRAEDKYCEGTRI